MGVGQLMWSPPECPCDEACGEGDPIVSVTACGGGLADNPEPAAFPVPTIPPPSPQSSDKVRNQGTGLLQAIPALPEVSGRGE